MDDGYWPLSILILVGFILIDAVLYGFGSAIQNLNVNSLEKEAEEGNERAGKLLRLINKPGEFINTVQVMTNIIGIVAGAYVMRQLGQLFQMLVKHSEDGHEMLVYSASVAAAGVIVLAVLISFGIVIPKKCGARKPEKWGYGVFQSCRCL